MEMDPIPLRSRQQSQRKQRSIWKAVARPAPFFFLCVVVKLLVARAVVFGTTSLDKLVWIDLPTIAVLILLIETFARKRTFWKYVIADFVVTAVLFAAIMYYKYYGVIVTYRALYQANQVVQVKASVWNLMHPYFLLLFLDLAVVLVLLACSTNVRQWAANSLRHPRWRRAAFVLLIPALLTSGYTAVSNRSIVNEWKQAEAMGILNYEVVQIASGMKKKPLDEEPVDVDTVHAVKGITPPEDPIAYGLAQGRNIIVVQMEALQNFPLGLTVEGETITPVLNALRDESYYFPYMFQQVGSGNTSDAEFLLNTSFYVPKEGPASQMYAHKQLPSLPRLLQANGYATMTFHTNAVQFWNRDELYAALGFERYYDEPTFGGEDLVHFGSSDEVLYRKTASILSERAQEGKPMYASLIAMTAHHPFSLPVEKQRITLPAAYKDTLVGNYLLSQNYADYALGTLVEQLKQEGLWENSMLVVYGDHMGLPLYALTQNEMQLMEQLIGKPYTYDTMLNIPLLVVIPGVTDGTVFPQTGGQIDLMPTIANLAGIPTDEQVMFGQDLINFPHNLLGQQYYLPSGSFLNDNHIFIPGESVEDGMRIALDKPGTGTGAEVVQEYLFNAAEAEVMADQYNRARQLIKMSDTYVTRQPNRN